MDNPLFDKEEKLRQKINHHHKAIAKYRDDAKFLVQAISQHYLIQKGLKKLPDHIREVVEKLDKTAYGKEKNEY
jgi:hypothetical protein